jgi:DNA (cytosine-5)-methyltransferase 1
MIEFYYRFFRKSFSSKIEQMISDIEKLMQIENLIISEKFDFVLDKKYSLLLEDSKRERINQLIYTIKNSVKIVSPTLLKFINKDQVIKKYTLVDTFAGCGWLSLGLENAWFNPVFVNEIEPKYLETYCFNRDLPIDNYFCGDIKTLVNSFDDYKSYFEDIDLLVGGPPCQWFSMANRQRVLDDPRNELYKNYLEFLHKVHPKFFIMENVKWILNKAEEIKNDFIEKVGSDYSIEIILLNAKDYWVPQNRERVFVIGSRLENVSASLIVSDILSSKLEKWFVLKEALSWLPVLKPKKEKNNSKVENEDIGMKFRKHTYTKTNFENFLNDWHVDLLSNHINRYNNERDVEIYDRLPQWANSLHESIQDIMPYKNRNHIFKDKYFKLNENEVSKTITSHMKFDCNMYIHPNEARWLSPRESARIQTFPDDFVFMWSNNNRYAQIGNAVPVKLAEVIGRNIFKHLKN